MSLSKSILFKCIEDLVLLTEVIKEKTIQSVRILTFKYHPDLLLYLKSLHPLTRSTDTHKCSHEHIHELTSSRQSLEIKIIMLNMPMLEVDTSYIAQRSTFPFKCH